MLCVCLQLVQHQVSGCVSGHHGCGVCVCHHPQLSDEGECCHKLLFYKTKIITLNVKKDLEWNFYAEGFLVFFFLFRYPETALS